MGIVNQRMRPRSSKSMDGAAALKPAKRCRFAPSNQRPPGLNLFFRAGRLLPLDSPGLPPLLEGRLLRGFFLKERFSSFPRLSPRPWFPLSELRFPRLGWRGMSSNPLCHGWSSITGTSRFIKRWISIMCLRSSSSLTNDHATPVAPARPVRPMR